MLLILQSSMFLTRNMKKTYEFTVIPRFTSLLVPKEFNVNRMTTQIEVRWNKKFDDVNRNNVNRGDVNRRITVFISSLVIKTTYMYICADEGSASHQKPSILLK